MAVQDQPFIITCSVTHTCPSYSPNLTWSRGEEDEISQLRRELPHGNWEVLSILTFIAKDKDDHSEVRCTANFDGGKKASTTVTLYLKREIFSLFSGLPTISAVYNHNAVFIGKESYRHIIIPAVVGTGTAAIFGVALFFILKKYRWVKHRDDMHGQHLSCKIFFCLASKGDVFQNFKIRTAGKNNLKDRHTRHIFTLMSSQCVLLC